MDDGRVFAVQVVDAQQDLARPLPHSLQLQVLVPLPAGRHRWINAMMSVHA